MSKSTSFGEYQSIVLDKKATIEVTNRTIRVIDNVYKTDNIASFGEGEIEIYKISWIAVIFSLFTAIFVSDLYPDWGAITFCIPIGGLIWNLVKPKHYGLLLTLSSGDKRLFITRDVDGIYDVIENIYELIESESNATYQVNVTDSQINGNFITGEVKADISSTIGDRIEGDKVGGDKVGGDKVEHNNVVNGKVEGYKFVDGSYIVDTSISNLIVDMFKMFIAGDSLASITSSLNNQGYRTSSGERWRSDTIKEILNNGFYAGLVKKGDNTVQGDHEPIISVEMYNEAIVEDYLKNKSR